MLARMNIKYAVGHGTTRDLWYVFWKTVEGQMTLKTKKSIFLDFSRLSA